MPTADPILTNLARDLDSPELRGALGFPLLGDLVVQLRAGESPLWRDEHAIGGASFGVGVLIDGTDHERFLGYVCRDAEQALRMLANDGVRPAPAFLHLDAANRPVEACSPSPAADPARGEERPDAGGGWRLTDDQLRDLEELLIAADVFVGAASTSSTRAGRLRRAADLIAMNVGRARAAVSTRAPAQEDCHV